MTGINIQKLCLPQLIISTSKFWKIVCEGEKVRARGCISSSAWYKLSFEPSTNSVRFVLFLYYKFMQQKSTNCTNSLNKKTHPNHKVTRRNVQMWLMAQMKAYTMPMKNCTLLCGPFHFRRLFSRTQMCTEIEIVIFSHFYLFHILYQSSNLSDI